MPGTMRSFDYFGRNPKPAASPVQAAYDTAGSAYRQQGQDYSDIMNKFRDVYDMAGGAGGRTLDFNFSPSSAVPAYQETQDYRNAFNNLSDLSRSGGFSAEDIDNIRARAVSPIRAIYGNAQRNVDRQRALAGGYSPNYTAATAKMAREQSSLLSDKMADVNAQIAENVAQNKIATAGPLANLAAGEQSGRNRFNLDAAELSRQMDLAKFNNMQSMYEFPIKTKLSALSGMTGLYGTTPAVANMTGNNALQTANLQNNINNSVFNRGLGRMTLYR